MGDGRHALVDRLLAEFEEVSREGSPRLVTLEAVSGWGKSRVVQEFYRRLAAAQPEPKFWPASILEATPVARGDGQEDGPGLTERRKRVFPQVFAPAEGSVPHWLWWGISATARKTGSVVDALASDLNQIETHQGALERRWRQVTGRKERLAQMVRRDESKSLGEAASQEVLSVGLEKLLEASVPGLGLLWWAGQVTWAQRERWSGGSQAAVEVDVSAAGREDLVAGLASSLGHFAAAGIPIVVAIEDVHEADASLVELLVRAVTQQRGPILIVATAWPGFLDDEDCTAHRLVAEIPQPAYSRLRGEALPELAPDDRCELVAALLPDAPTVARTALAGRYRNPFLLELVCQSPRVVELVEDGELDEAEVARLPEDAADVYREMWKSLPEQLREALMLAVLAAPANVGGLFANRVWDVGVAAHAWRSLPRLQAQADVLRGLLAESGDAYAWVRSVDDWLQACHEPVQEQVALTHATERYSDRRRRRYYQALADSVDLDDPALSPPRRRTQAQLLTALAAEGFIDWTSPIVAAADLLIEEAAEAHDIDSLRTAISLGAAVPDTEDDRATWHRRHLVATALGRSGQVEPAIEAFTRLLNDRQRVFGADHPATLTTRNNLAGWLGEAGRTDEAIKAFTQLLDDRQQVLGANHPDTLLTRNNLAGWLGEAGRTDEAIKAFTQLLEGQKRVLGANHPDTLATRHNLANSLGQAGRTDQAIEQHARLLDDRQQVLGDDHPDTLATRNSLAYSLGQAGRTDEAIKAFTQLLEDQKGVLGANHPDTLTTRHNLADWLGKAGRPGQAIEQFTQLLNDRQRVLGADHPDTLGTRHNMAHWLGQAGRAHETIEQFTRLLKDLQETLGADHSNTLITRNSLAQWLRRSRRLDEAIEQFTRLLDDRQRVFGVDHPDTLSTRNNLAKSLREAGRIDEAIEQFSQLLNELQETLGADHPSTLATRHNLAKSLGEAGRTDEAIKAFTQLLDDQQQVLGADHPDTLVTRNSLANSLGEAGRLDQAIEQLARLLDDMKRALGVDHPDTLSTRFSLAHWIRRSGRLDEAIEQLARLLGDLQRVLGADHPDTLATGNCLAQWLGESGRPDQAD